MRFFPEPFSLGQSYNDYMSKIPREGRRGLRMYILLLEGLERIKCSVVIIFLCLHCPCPNLYQYLCHCNVPALEYQYVPSPVLDEEIHVQIQRATLFPVIKTAKFCLSKKNSKAPKQKHPPPYTNKLAFFYLPKLMHHHVVFEQSDSS